MNGFNKKWEKPNRKPVRETIKEAVAPNEPLKNRIEIARKTLDTQILKLEKSILKLKERETNVFKRTVEAVQKNDKKQASLNSNELVEIKKALKMASQTKITLDQISLRISSVENLGDVASSLSPAISVLKNVSSSFRCIFPAASREFDEVSGLLNEITHGSGKLNSMQFSEQSNEEVEQIIKEATVIAEQKTSEKIPSMPKESVNEGII
jgi:division protein CdvB (Snf7/Vps24/ESCRT-III family)